MNHHYPENYHGYVRGAAGMQNMGYGHGGYDDQMTMGHMGQSRTNYQMSHYRDNSQMHPMMHQQSNMYPSGGYMNQAGGSSYGMGGYSNYGVTNQANMMMGPRNVMGRYYNHPMDSRNSQHAPAASPNSTFNQSSVGNSLHCQSPMNRMPTNQNCSQSQTPTLQGVQVSHCASPHTMSTTHSNSGFQGPSINHALIPSVEGQQRPVAGNMPASGMHSIPQHPMRHPTTQQNPQEVADNILQIASSYPANQTVQVPLKSRHAPYHIPRSPHYSMSSSDHSHPSPMASHSQQPSPAPQPSPTPSTSSVKSPTPSLAPIPNPIPSPGVAGLRSPNNQGATACGNQRSPAHMASNFSGHSQPSPSPHHYSPTGIGNQQNFSSFAQSPPASRIMPTSFPQPNDTNIYPNSDLPDIKPSYSSPLPNSASPHTLGVMSEPTSSNANFNQGNGNNPLMSLQKLVMLPETQVVDPKSVVNDACLSSQSIENDEVPKNVEDPAEGCAKSSHSSVGSSGQSSSHTLISAVQAEVGMEAKVSISNLSPLLETTADNSTVNGNLDTLDNSSEESPKNVENGEVVTQVHCLEDNHKSPLSPPSEFVMDSGNKNDERLPPISSGESHEKKELNSVNCNWERSQEICTGLSDVKKPQPLEPDDITMEVKSECENDCDVDEQQNNSVLHSLKLKNGKVNGLSEDVKRPFQCKSPCVLSEVPLLVNGLSATENIDDSVNEGNDDGREFQNGFTPRLRSKLRFGEKSGQFVRLTTPCSISVGADERALCERFVFRRNDYCHTLRTSRLLCNGRTRQDSTGNGDSDESIENVLDNTFVMGNPQDGSKKKPSSNPSKKNDMKKTIINSSSQVTKKDGKSSKEGQLCKPNNGHLSNSNELNAEASDEDGDVCYYEGVDSSDFYMNNGSSDDSISSSQEGKQTILSSTSPDKNYQNSSLNADGKKISQEKGNINDDISSPPSKRTRTASVQRGQDSVNKRCVSSSSSEDQCNNFEETKKGTSSKQDLQNQIGSQTEYPENGKVTRSRLSRRKIPAMKEKLINEQCKLPEVIVRLEKSPIFKENTPFKVEPGEMDPVKVENIILIDDSSPEKEGDNVSPQFPVIPKTESDMASVKVEAEPSSRPDNTDSNVKNDNLNSRTSDMESIKCANPGSSKVPSRRKLTSQKKRPMKKRKKQMPLSVNKDRNDEVKDSFKSMKFSRTLDMLKYQKKKDSCYTGPFIRIEGNKNAPKTVSVFNQSSQDLLSSTSKHKKTQRQSHNRNVSTTVHMVSNLTNDKTVILSSTKVLPNKQWSCAFCSHHSSFQSLGDLFGPYFKEVDLPILEKITSEESKKAESNKDSPKSANISVKQSKSQNDKKGQKKKMPTKPDQHLPQEIWLHESCALWAPGVYLIGNKIYGLDDAIRDAAETICSVCKGKGAMIGCLYKGCAMKYHFSCAIEKECHLDESNFSLLCPKHKDKKFITASSSSSSMYVTQKKS